MRSITYQPLMPGRPRSMTATSNFLRFSSASASSPVATGTTSACSGATMVTMCCRWIASSSTTSTALPFPTATGSAITISSTRRRRLFARAGWTAVAGRPARGDRVAAPTSAGSCARGFGGSTSAPLDGASAARRGGGGMVPAGRYTVKVLPLPGWLFSVISPPQQAHQLAADRKAQTCAAELAAGGAVALGERLEDRPLHVQRDPDAGVGHAEGHHAFRLRQHLRRPT